MNKKLHNTVYQVITSMNKANKKLHIETFGCQMNFSDSEIVASVMTSHDFEIAAEPGDADVIFLNTCSIRDHAERRVINRLRELQHLRKKTAGTGNRCAGMHGRTPEGVAAG